MKKMFTLLLTVLFTLFTLPVSSLTVFAAEEKSYDNLKNGTYNIIAKAMHETEDKKSGAADFLNEEATLNINDGEIKLTIIVPHNEMATIDGIQVEGIEAEVKKDDKFTYHTFNLTDSKNELPSRVQYSVPSINMEHDVPFRFILEGLDDLPVNEVETGSEDGTEEDAGSEEGTEEDAGSEDGTEEDTGLEEGTEEDAGSEEGTEEDAGSEKGNDETSLLDDGSYTLDVSYLHSDKDEPSSMGRHLDEKAFLNVQDGKYEVTITVKEHNTVTKLQVNNQNSKYAKLDGEKRHETFEVNNITSDLNAYVEYQAPMRDGSIHKGNATFRILFDEDSIEEATANQQPGNDIKATLIQLDNGHYTVDATYLRADNDDTSSMGRHLGDSVFVSVEDGMYYLTMTINKDETVTLLTVNGETADEKVVNGDKRYETFEIADLLSLQNAYVEYQAPMGEGKIHKGNADFRISLDAQSVHSVKADDKPGKVEEENEKKPEEDKDKETVEEPKEDKQKKDNALVPDKTYNIQYVIKHEDGIKDSTADQFFEKPGILLEKDNVLYAQLTITNGNMIKELSTQYGDVLIVKENSDGSIVVQFKVNKDLSNMNIEMKIVVPGLYSSDHKAILVFDKDSMKQIDGSEYKLAASNTDNGPTVKDAVEGKPLGDGNENNEGNEDDKELNGSDDLDKPTFGSTDKDGQKIAASTKGPHNPQTGDTSSILFYTLLLLGSMVPLAVKFRRRFV